MLKSPLLISFDDIISLDNLLQAWSEFIDGKRNRKDVQVFGLKLMENLINLHDDLINQIYVHGGYHAFKVNDPKPRDIHKASVRDRIVHHAIYRILYPYLDQKFIFDSYSCRNEKGTHRAINRFRNFFWKVSRNNTRTCWVLKCDIKKFFANIDHGILKSILQKHICDEKILWLLNQVIDSFQFKKNFGVGLPLGNLTSQLLVNVYMNNFDHYVKRLLKVKYYIRFADDFVVLSESKDYLAMVLNEIQRYLNKQLRLALHPNKVNIKTFSSGLDFLGWINFTDHRVLRKVTKRRMLKRINENPTKDTLQSYLGLLKHGNTYRLAEKVSTKCHSFIMDKKPIIR